MERRELTAQLAAALHMHAGAGSGASLDASASASAQELSQRLSQNVAKERQLLVTAVTYVCMTRSNDVDVSARVCVAAW